MPELQEALKVKRRKPTNEMEKHLFAVVRISFGIGSDTSGHMSLSFSLFLCHGATMVHPLGNSIYEVYPNPGPE